MEHLGVAELLRRRGVVAGRPRRHRCAGRGGTGAGQRSRASDPTDIHHVNLHFFWDLGWVITQSCAHQPAGRSQVAGTGELSRDDFFRCTGDPAILLEAVGCGAVRLLQKEVPLQLAIPAAKKSFQFSAFSSSPILEKELAGSRNHLVL